MSNYGLDKDDYKERGCCDVSRGTVDTDRALDKLDAYFSRGDFNGAKRHLLYWTEEAKSLGDRHGLLTLVNECIGLYRKTGDKDKALACSVEAIELAEELGLSDSVTMGTTYINAATGYSAFGEYEKAAELYEKAKTLYEKLLESGDDRLGGLYNNMALCMAELNKFDYARELFGKALEVTENAKGGEPNAAVTYCNLADLAVKEYGDEAAEKTVDEYLEKAFALFDKAKDRCDGVYAYACEKSAPAFGRHGYFMYEKTLENRARDIYESN